MANSALASYSHVAMQGYSLPNLKAPGQHWLHPFEWHTLHNVSTQQSKVSGVASGSPFPQSPSGGRSALHSSGTHAPATWPPAGDGTGTGAGAGTGDGTGDGTGVGVTSTTGEGSTGVTSGEAGIGDGDIILERAGEGEGEGKGTTSTMVSGVGVTGAGVGMGVAGKDVAGGEGKGMTSTTGAGVGVVGEGVGITVGVGDGGVVRVKVGKGFEATPWPIPGEGGVWRGR